MIDRTIWKFQLNITDEQKVDMPFVFKFRHVAPTYIPSNRLISDRDLILSERINVWAEVEPESEIRPHKFFIVGTGYSVPEDGIFVGTAVMPSGLVWHVFWAVI